MSSLHCQVTMEGNESINMSGRQDVVIGLLLTRAPWQLPLLPFLFLC